MATRNKDLGTTETIKPVEPNKHQKRKIQLAGGIFREQQTTHQMVTKTLLGAT